MPAPAISPAQALADCEAALAAIDLNAIDPSSADSIRRAIRALDRLNLANAALTAVKTQPTISVDQAAALLGVNRITVYGPIEAGEIPSIRLGRRIRIPSAYVLRQLTIEA